MTGRAVARAPAAGATGGRPLDSGPDADLLDGRRAAEQALGGAEPARTVRRLVVVRGFERPDPLAQPGQEGALLREAAEQGLTEMKVSLDEAGE